VYETRNRPAWVGIPLAGVRALVGRTGTAGPGAPEHRAEAGVQPRAGAPEGRAEAGDQPRAGAPAQDAQGGQNLAENAGRPSKTTIFSRGADDAAPRAQAKPLDEREVELLMRGLHRDPHSLLGAHPHDGGITIRALRPLAESVTVRLEGGERHEMEHE